MEKAADRAPQSTAPQASPHQDSKAPAREDAQDERRWTLIQTRGCPSGQRNAAEHECLNAVQEAVLGEYIVAEFKVLTRNQNPDPNLKTLRNLDPNPRPKREP